MTQITEILEEKPSVLIVSKKDHSIIHLLKLELKRHKVEVFFSPHIPRNLSRFTYCFLLNQEELPNIEVFPSHLKVAIIFINKTPISHKAAKFYKNPSIKIINITGDKIIQNHIDKILWFTFSKTKETFLQLTAAKIPRILKTGWHFPKIQVPGRRRLIIYILFLFLFLHLAFFPPLLISSYFLYQASTTLKQDEFLKTEKLVASADLFYKLAKRVYHIPRATYLFFSLSFPDNLFDLNEKTHLTFEKTLSLQKNVNEVIKVVLKKDKSVQDKSLLPLRINTIKNDVGTIEENITFISQKIPRFLPASEGVKTRLTTYLDLITNLKRILPHLDSILAKNSDKTYLLLFANNMELRPGGGFIGSFGILHVKDYSIEEIKIYDVYDADGQLVAHVEPPDAIRQYLGQPNWFLRDSAFSADFLENYIQAKFFLEKELGFKNFSGSFLITTTAIQNILGAFGEIYLPDFKEKVNQKNFYLKTQYYSEKDFFPGSIQKKNFLSSLTQALLLELENVSPSKLIKEIKKSLDEKQIVLYLDDSKPQKVFDSLYWSGRSIKTTCATQTESCLIDYIFPIDANLGLNKANFFISRSLVLKIDIDRNGLVTNSISILFNNDSTDVYPGGTYKNYFQLYLPQNATITNILHNGVLVENYSQVIDQYKKIGFFLEVKPKSQTELKINYRLADELSKGESVYQLIVQKQIGSPNSDFVLELSLPKNIRLLNHNFPALVKDKQIIYNTSLAADKIFFLELIKE